MANLKVVLQRYVKTVDKDWHRVRVEPVKTGRGFTKDWTDPKTYGPDCVALGPYNLKWYMGGKAQYTRVGEDLQEALNAQKRKQANLAADESDREAGRSPREEDPTRKTLVKWKERFIEKKRDKQRDAETISSYAHLITEFMDVTKRRFAEDVTEDDMQDFCRALRNRGLAERTVMNYAGSVLTFLRSTKVLSAAKIDEIKEAIPKVVDPLPVAYTKAQYESLMAAITNERHRLILPTSPHSSRIGLTVCSSSLALIPPSILPALIGRRVVRNSTGLDGHGDWHDFGRHSTAIFAVLDAAACIKSTQLS
jgi:hypothetical protein